MTGACLPGELKVGPVVNASRPVGPLSENHPEQSKWEWAKLNKGQLILEVYRFPGIPAEHTARSGITSVRQQLQKHIRQGRRASVSNWKHVSTDKPVYSSIFTKHPPTALCWIEDFRNINIFSSYEYRFTASYFIAFILVRYEWCTLDNVSIRRWYWGGGPADLNTCHYNTTYRRFLSAEPIMSLCVLPNSFTQQMVTCNIVQQINWVVIASVDWLNGWTDDEMSATCRNPDFISRHSTEEGIMFVASLVSEQCSLKAADNITEKLMNCDLEF